MDAKLENGVLILHPTGNINSTNAASIEKEVHAILQNCSPEEIVVDCDELQYSSSAGLRMILRLKRHTENTSLINVHAELYEVLEMTGFTEMMTVKKAYRVVSVENCELIGEGANGKIYRIDDDNVVKVYTNANALPQLLHDREIARAAFVLGIPMAIPYDVVQIKEGGYGSVYEMLNAKTYAQLLNGGVKSPDEIAGMSIDLLKLIHSRVAKPDVFPSFKDIALDWALFLKDYLPEDQFEKLYALIDAVPESLNMIHGDYHLKNIMYLDGDSLLIDMDTLSCGNPIFELAGMYNAYCGFGEVDHEYIMRFLGIPYETGKAFWHKSLELYLGTKEEKRIREVEEKAKLLGQTRIMRRTIRRNGLNTEEGRKQIEYARETIAELLPRVDSLTI